MMKPRLILLLCGLFLLSACGPMIGGMMAAGNGVKDFSLERGRLETLQPGSRLAVLGPFATTPSSFEICRGEEAATFASLFNQTGLFSAELAMNSRFSEESSQVADWRGKSPQSIQEAFALDNPPDLLMSAVILNREMIPAPTKGIIMKVGYRLDFLNLQTGEETSVEVKVQEMFHDAVQASVDALATHLVNH